jgi:two-component sensor histidine kinase
MALIHETLYRTRRYSRVDMGLYLRTLVGQITSSYGTRSDVHVDVSSDTVFLDLARATPCGLIVNELVTNSFKYAFPTAFSCPTVRDDPCRIAVSLRHDGDQYLLSVSDNGVGLPDGFDARTARSLGLKLVNFLARHQLRAVTDIRSSGGTTFEFRFPVSQP